MSAEKGARGKCNEGAAPAGYLCLDTGCHDADFCIVRTTAPRSAHAFWGTDPSGYCGCDDCNAPDPNGTEPPNRTQIPAPVDDLCQTCGCGKDGDGDCPCGCTLDSTREAFALGAAWALGDDDEAPAALRAEVERLSTERDRYRTAWKSAATRAGIAGDQAEQLRVRIARAEVLIDSWEHDAPDHSNPVFIGRLRECLRRDSAPVRLRGENRA